MSIRNRDPSTHRSKRRPIPHEHRWARESAACVSILILLVIGLGCAARGTEEPVIESTDAPIAQSESHTLRVATANLWGVDVLGFDWAADIDERFAAMAERLGENAERLDVVLIQEAWKDEARRALLSHPGVLRNFPHRVDAVEKPGGSGLVILSRFPIEATRFHRFRAQGRCAKFWEGDCLSGKGVLGARIRAFDGPFWVVNTHLIACYSRGDETNLFCDHEDPNGAVRFEQVLEARCAAEGWIGRMPAVFGGDFNFSRTSRYYPLMTGTSIAASKLDLPPRSCGDRVDRGWFEKGRESGRAGRIDYLWTRPGNDFHWQIVVPAHAIFRQPVLLRSGRQVSVSDHPILAAELCLLQKETSTMECSSPPRAR